jgi:hypothetical protein
VEFALKALVSKLPQLSKLRQFWLYSARFLVLYLISNGRCPSHHQDAEPFRPTFIIPVIESIELLFACALQDLRASDHFEVRIITRVSELRLLAEDERFCESEV